MNWICSQIGAREHYAIPRVLHQGGKLDGLYTDLWASPLWREMGNLLGRPILATRYHRDLATARVTSFNLSTLVDKAFGGGATGSPYDWFLSVGSDFGRSVEADLQRRKEVNWPETIFFGYDTGFLEPARWARSQGAKTVVCQMDPSRVEVDLVKTEERLWPGWARKQVDVPEAYFMRREKEWKAADLVMVNSEWSRQALIQQGDSEGKMVVVPLAYELPQLTGHIPQDTDLAAAESGLRLSAFDSRRKLRALFLGQVILRKGIQYLIEAARSLQNESVHFDVVGPLGISDDAVESAPKNMTFHGAISRDKAPEFFANADVFILPTLSDGFAITQIEAMAYGVPVIATPNCGAVVSDGVDGIIVEVRDSGALASAMQSLVHSPERLNVLSRKASEKAAYFGLNNLRKNLLKIESGFA